MRLWQGKRERAIEADARASYDMDMKQIGVVRQSLTGLKAPRSHKSMKRRFETTQ
jgi:hypothetical protein